MKGGFYIKLIIYTFIVIGLTSCIRSPPDEMDNVCAIFKQYPDWYWATRHSQRKWKVPVSVQMAIMHQESRFNATARPPRTKILWVIPWTRPTSAYGYSQAINQTWRLYKRKSGNHSASRTTFDDAADFIGWFSATAHRKLGISEHNAFQLYLAYHEGLKGYHLRTYRHKPWLVRVAKKVQRRAWRYHAQLMRCRYKLKKKSWWKRLF